MKFLITLSFAVGLALGGILWALPSRAQQPPAAAQAPDSNQKPHIDLVFAIDCSGSMGAVINTAKQKVWAIVNEIAKAKPAPVLRIGLLGYGNGNNTYRMFPLSDDLDEVYKNLMTFKDEGWGSEFVGLAIHKATSEMKWEKARQQLKVIYVVGNETARQGPDGFDYTITAPAAIRSDINVNAIYCGNAGGQETWRELATLADGQYMEIAASGGAITVATPFDKQLDTLSVSLNKTYLAYGAAGKDRFANQSLQDLNARQAGGFGAGAERALAKSAVQYNNRMWDLVDASREKDFDLAKIKDTDLPEEMRKMTLAERKAHIAKKSAERTALQDEIKALSAKRDAHVKAEIAKQGLNTDKSFDEAIRKSVTEQARKKGFKFEDR